MKVCPYCRKEVGNRIYETDSEMFEDYDYVDTEGRKLYYADYIVTCPNCKGGFHWTEIFQRLTVFITNADTNEEWVYDEESE